MSQTSVRARTWIVAAGGLLDLSGKVNQAGIDWLVEDLPTERKLPALRALNTIMAVMFLALVAMLAAVVALAMVGAAWAGVGLFAASYTILVVCAMKVTRASRKTAS